MRMLTIDRWRISGHAEAVREMSAFPISHPAICAPVGGILDDESPTLLFPWWNGGQISHWITRERELRWTRTANGLRREPPSEDVMARYDTDMHLSVEIFRKHRIIRKLVFVGIGDLGWAQTKDQADNDIYAMGYILENLCGDFFSDMTPRERSAYDDEMFAKGFPTGASLPHEQLMVDPLVCQRPPETKPRQKKHPDGPREIGKDKL
ncbi:hypothetical protein R1sor_014573 [Riccia sorocarpa]|uniref:Uncharacterized protein n=1 Tax=Riccia sorocarpa TaxID=122646 RepID=A0ABD3HFW2_9MARC